MLRLSVKTVLPTRSESESQIENRPEEKKSGDKAGDDRFEIDHVAWRSREQVVEQIQFPANNRLQQKADIDRRQNGGERDKRSERGHSASERTSESSHEISRAERYFFCIISSRFGLNSFPGFHSGN